MSAHRPSRRSVGASVDACSGRTPSYRRARRTRAMRQKAVEGGMRRLRQERPFPKQATNASIRTEADIRALRNSGKTQRSESLGKHDEDEHFDLAAQIANWAVCSGQDVQLFCLGSEEHSQLLQESRECGLVF